MNRPVHVALVAPALSPTASVVTQLVRSLVTGGAIDAQVFPAVTTADGLARFDIVHTIGSMSSVDAWAAHLPPTATWIHTLDTVSLGRFRLHLRQQRGGRAKLRRPTPAIWLVHGRAAAGRLVTSGLARSERVLCLPLLPPVVGAAPAGEPLAALRTQVRAACGIPPGVQLVLGAGSCADSSGFTEFQSVVSHLDRHAVRALWVDTLGSSRPRTTPSGVEVVDVSPESLRLLAAADVLVAAARRLEATTTGTLAVQAGIPFIASETDSAAELVIPGTRGVIVRRGRSTLLATALQWALDGEQMPAPRRNGIAGRPEAMTSYLLNAYGAAASWWPRVADAVEGAT